MLKMGASYIILNTQNIYSANSKVQEADPE